MTTKAQRKIHMVMQGKGGVAKTFVSIMLSQYLKSTSPNVLCADTDPVNATFTGISALGVQRVEIMSGDEVDQRAFDTLIEMIAAHDGDVVVDNGAASFIPLASYMMQNDVPGLLASMDCQLVIHSIITGGQAILDTLNGFNAIMSQFPDGPEFVVWLNPFFGPIEVDGKPFEKMKVYTENKARISGIVQLPNLKVDTFGQDLRAMLQDRLTFDQALASDALPIMVRQRLTMAKKQIFGAINLAIG